MEPVRTPASNLARQDPSLIASLGLVSSATVRNEPQDARRQSEGFEKVPQRGCKVLPPGNADYFLFSNSLRILIGKLGQRACFLVPPATVVPRVPGRTV